MERGIPYEETPLGELPKLDEIESWLALAVSEIRGETPLGDIYAWCDENQITDRQVRRLVVDAVRAAERAASDALNKRLKASE